MGTSIENVITLQLGCELQSKPIGAKFSPLLCGTVNGHIVGGFVQMLQLGVTFGNGCYQQNSKNK